MSTTGKLILDKPTGNISFAVSGEPAATGYTVTFISKSGFSLDYLDRAYVQYANGAISSLSNCTIGTILNNVVKIATNGNARLYFYLGDSGTTTANIEGGYWDGEFTENAYTLTQNIRPYSCLTTNCIDENTLITMYDGTEKAMKDITVGDIVLSIDFDNMKLIGRKVIYACKDEPDYDQWVAPMYYKHTFSDGTIIKRAMNHRFYNLEEQRYVYMHEWDVSGQHTYNLEGENPTLVSTEVIQEPLHYARITLEDSNNYFANGLSTGDRYCPTGIILDKPLQKV